MTTQTEVDAHMNSLTDHNLLTHLAIARDDLEDAAKHHHESEWHEACFAGYLCYAMEAGKRGLL